MRISDLLSVCLRNLTRRVRTALTVIGVVIGVCAIILMVSLGIGARESMMQMLQEWGDLTIINVYNYGGGETKLDDKALSKIQAMDHDPVLQQPGQLPAEIPQRALCGLYQYHRHLPRGV